MARMTDEEADALDKYYTENTIMPVRGKPGLFVERKAQNATFYFSVALPKVF